MTFKISKETPTKNGRAVYVTDPKSKDYRAFSTVFKPIKAGCSYREVWEEGNLKTYNCRINAQIAIVSKKVILTNEEEI